MYNKKNEENIIEKYSLQNKDKIRMKIFNFLKENSLTTNQKKSIEFYKYITEDNQQNLFYTYMTILLGGYDEKLAFMQNSLVRHCHRGLGMPGKGSILQARGLQEA